MFVAGMAGWGEESSLSRVAPYWGLLNFDIIRIVRSRGFEAYTAAVAPLGSAWDRACELYAQLVGGRVDYGKAHSEKNGHDRYGVTYDKPLFEGFGEQDESGKIRKVNFICHSFGGTTVRMLSYLLEHGDEAERESTTDGSLSPLFEGGHKGLIFSITTLSTPHNGTDLQRAVQMPLSKFVVFAYFSVSCLCSMPLFGNLYDVQLSQFGIGKGENGEQPKLLSNIRNTAFMASGKDQVFYDVSVDGTMQINNRISIQDDIYYFSFPVCGTNENRKSNQVHRKDMFPLIRLFADRLGKYECTTEDGHVVDDAWKPNDGVVHTVSQAAPTTEPSVAFDETKIEKGVWNVMPVVTGDHGSVVGWGRKQKDVMPLYCAHMSLVEKLSKNNN